MKYFVISDIHGSSYYLKKVLDEYHKDKYDKLIILGDILYHGPRNDLPEGYAPKECIAMLNHLKDEIEAVRGNCEAEVDQMVLEFPCMETFKTLKINDRKIYLTHGHVYNIDKLPEDFKENDVILHGHTHIPTWTEFGKNNLCLNPGSITIPKNGSKHSYMIIEGNEVKWLGINEGIYHRISL